MCIRDSSVNNNDDDDGHNDATTAITNSTAGDVEQRSNFQTLVLQFEFEFNLHTVGIRISDYY